MDKIKVTRRQRGNAIEARDVMWPSVPQENVSGGLCEWREDHGHESNPPTCGTIACFGGWCQHWPRFQTQYRGNRSLHPGRPVGFWQIGESAEKLFGDPLIFNMRGAHPADKLGVMSLSDHDLVTQRLNWLIENSEVIE